MPTQIDRIPLGHYAFCTEGEAIIAFREIYKREPTDEDIKFVDRGEKFGKMYFVECESE